MARRAVLGLDRGRHSMKLHLVVNDPGALRKPPENSEAQYFEFSHVAPSLAVPEPQGADQEGDPQEKVIIEGRHWLVGNRALSTSPDALFRTVGSKTEGAAADEFFASVCAALAWADSKVDIQSLPVVIVSSAPDSEYDRALPGLKEILTDSFQFQTAYGRPIRVDVPAERVMVARESMAPFWAHTTGPDGEYLPYDDNPLQWVIAGRPDQEDAYPARTLVVGVGFRDFSVADTEGGKRLASRSGPRGVSEIYGAVWDLITGPSVGYNLKSRAEVDKVLSGRHPIWAHRDPVKLDAAIQQVIQQKGAALLAEAVQWAGEPESYHTVLAAGGGCLMLKRLVEAAFPKVRFAAQTDSARGLAYAGVRASKPKPQA